MKLNESNDAGGAPNNSESGREHDKDAMPPTTPSWPERNQQLASAWLDDYGRAVMTSNKPRLRQLFHADRIVIDGHDLVPCDPVDLRRFRLVLDAVKVLPLSPTYVLVVAPWVVMSRISNGGHAVTGDSTFLLFITEPHDDVKGSVECVYAHFSRRPTS